MIQQMTYRINNYYTQSGYLKSTTNFNSGSAFRIIYYIVCNFRKNFPNYKETFI